MSVNKQSITIITILLTYVLDSSLIWTCRISNIVVFYRQAQLKKSKQMFEIRHFQIDDLARTLSRDCKLEENEVKTVNISTLFSTRKFRQNCFPNLYRNKYTGNLSEAVYC